jgi:hypothetical protein
MTVYKGFSITTAYGFEAHILCGVKFTFSTTDRQTDSQSGFRFKFPLLQDVCTYGDKIHFGLKRPPFIIYFEDES